MIKCIIIIPARYKSSRFPGKPLAKIFNKTMIECVHDKCLMICKKKNIYVATDSKKIKNYLIKKKINVIMTSKNCLTGTDRVAEASKKIKSKIIINVQGDEPLISSNDIKLIYEAKKKNPKNVICGYNEINNPLLAKSANVPKIVKNENNELIYISRSKIPGSKSNKIVKKYYRQVCIYAFNKKQLSQFYKYGKKSLIEKTEDIELLRFFELNQKIKLVKLSNNSIAVDTKTDLQKVLQKIKQDKKENKYI